MGVINTKAAVENVIKSENLIPMHHMQVMPNTAKARASLTFPHGF